MSGVSSSQRAFLLNVTHQPAHVLPRQTGDGDNLALLHAGVDGVGHGDSEGSAGGIGTVLGGLLCAGCLPQCSEGFIGGGHVDMFAHPGGHTEARPYLVIQILACGHIDVASWMCKAPP